MTSPTTGLGVLTAGKTVSNVGVRWVGVFMPVLTKAFGASTSTVTSIMGFAELSGLATSLTGGLNDRGHERKVFVAGMVAIAASSFVALLGTIEAFAVSFTLLVLGLSQSTVAAHSWISHRVPYHQRSRSIGLFETSWALALLIGAPILAALIHLFGWRGGYLAIGTAAAVGATAAWFRVPRSGHAGSGSAKGPSVPLPRSAWAPMLASAASAHAGIGFFVITGTWLADSHSLGTTGLGIAAATYGCVELVASTAVATLTDRVGPKRAVGIGLFLMVLAVVLLAVAGSSTPVAIAGIVLYLGGFEYGFVSSLALVSEAAPLSRGRAIGISNSLGTVARASGVALSGTLYDAFGIAGPLTGASIAITLAVLLLAATDVSASSTASVEQPA